MNLKEVTFKYWIRCYLYNNKYILYLRRNIKSNLFYCVFLFVSFPYILLRWIILVAYEQIYAIENMYRKMLAERSRKFKHEIAMVVISKNEGQYIREWIEYHKLVGFTKFYFYDNESEDNTRQVLRPYIDAGLVEYTLISGKARQLDAYNDAVRRHKDECRWMAFMDMDEFLMPTEPFRQVAEIVSDIVFRAGKGAVGISVNWAVYGSSHLDEKPKGLVIDNFVDRADVSHWSSFMVKTICNPRMVANYISPHYPLYKAGGYSINDSDGKRQYGWFCYDVVYQNLRINHYCTKSRQEFIKKRARGLADREGQYDMSIFDVYNLNDVHDEAMRVYSCAIKAVLADWNEL